MLDETLVKQLRLAVFRFIGTDASVDKVAHLVGDELAVEVPKVDKAFEVAVWVVERALRARKPDLLVQMVREVDIAGQFVALQQAADALLAAPETWLVQRQDLLVVPDGSPFVDRRTFRDHLAAIDRGEGPACLVVEGGEGAGKSYLRAYCQQLASEGLRMGFVEITATNAKSLDPGDVAVRLAQAIGVPFKKQPREHENPDRWAENLATWIVGHAPDKGSPALLFLDGFENKHVAPALHTFVLQLVQRLQDDPEAQARLRVILLGYDRGRLEEAELTHESYVLEFVDHDQLVDWFKRRFPDQEEYAWTDAADMVLERIPEEGPGRMQKLCTEVLKATGGFL